MTDDFIRVGGNLAYTNTWLKLICLVLIVLILTLSSAVIVLVAERTTERVVPIVINEATGDAMAVDYRVIDAAGELRSPVEVRKFCQDFFTDAFTFNRFTARTHLESLANYSTPAALEQIRASLNLAQRAEYMNRSAQGLFEITSFMITETQPALKIQIYFRTRVLAGNGDTLSENSQLAVLTVRPVRRTEQQPHGLIVIEYLQNPFINPNQEK